MKTMKAQRVVLPLALLSAVFLLGCQEQGSSPMEPEGLAPQFDPGGAGKGGAGKKGGSVLAGITVTGGMVTPAGQVVSFKDGEGKIELQRVPNEKKSIAGIQLRFSLTNTHGYGRVPACVQEGSSDPGNDLQALFDQLVATPLQGLKNFWVSIDKTALGVGSSESHVINVSWFDSDGDGSRQLIVGTHPNLDLSATVTSDNPLTFKFTGGSVTVVYHPSKAPGGRGERFMLTCPNLDAITMELVAQ